MGKKLDKLLLLLWKNFLLQWRRPIQAIVEILVPLLFSMLLVILRSLVVPEAHPVTSYIPFNTTLLADLDLTKTTVAWSPKNPALEKIMKMTVKNIYKKSGIKTETMSFNNGQQLQNYLNSVISGYTAFAGIEFGDSLAGLVDLPPNMDITFRFSSELRKSHARVWRTERVFPIYQPVGPRDWLDNEGAIPSYYLEGFLMLQQELAFSIIDHFKQDVHKKSFDHNSVSINMQRFPYPEWIQDDLLTILPTFVGLIIMLSFVYTCISTVKIITTEKEKQLKEAMKIMGLPNWLHWTAWFVRSFTFLIVTIILLVVLIKANWYSNSNHTVFTYSDPFVMFVFLVLYMCATITFCFCVSAFFSKANTAAMVSGMVWFLTHFPYILLQKKYATLTLCQKLSASLLLNTAMAYGFQLIMMYEGIEEGIQWHNIWKKVTPEDNLVLGHLMVMLIADTLIYLLIALYVEAVFPGEYGVPLPYHFPFTTSYWCGGHADDINIRYSIIEGEFYEREPSDLKAGIKVQNLHKKFSKNKIAVKDLTLNIYQDQITVLLGHNGAGKTTTMSMLIGMFPPTSGTAFIEGYDIRKDMSHVRENLGLCPQHNILFDDLTVSEHLYFYSRLKGLRKDKIEDDINKYIASLELEPKRNQKSSTLSGGMKRKLSVGIALCGDSKVVMCDEPTAGMDPAARRALWDLLIAQKKGRTILLSTHYMDEADILGDRIAIMAGGMLQCYGSSFFLKKKYGAGYHLVMDKSPQCNVAKVTELLQKYIPIVKVDRNVGSELSYILSEEYSIHFEKMLEDLEKNSGNLGILSYGISVTTLEEVFMKNCVLALAQRFLSGCALWRNQLFAMLIKRILSTVRAWILLLIQNMIPVVCLILAIIITKVIDSELPKFKYHLDSFENPVTVLTRDANNNPYSESYINFLNKSNKIVINWETASLTEKMLEVGRKQVATFRQRYITGASFESKSITAWFNNQPFHSPPLALQLVLNAVLHKEVSAEHNLQFNLFPLPYRIDTKLARLTLGMNSGFNIAFNLGFSMAFVSAFYTLFYVKERVSKAKHLQFVSGISVTSFWLAAFICDLLTFAFTTFLIIIVFVYFQVDGFRTAVELRRLFIIMLYFGFAMLVMMSLASYFFYIPSTGYARMSMVNVFTGIAAFVIVQILSQPELKLKKTADTLHQMFLLVPHYSFTTSIQDNYKVSSTHKLCEYGMETCLDLGLPGLTPELCRLRLCKKIPGCCDLISNFYDMKPPGIGKNILYSCAVGVALIKIILIIEFKILEKILHKLPKKRIHPTTDLTEIEIDNDVLDEKIKIKTACTKDIQNTNLVMFDITKYYKQVLAVDKICLGVDKYECFGLLGINGAGKTTTFKILTGDIKPSSGDAWVNGWNVKTHLSKINKLIGYCPQFDALLEDLTSRETLVIFSLLRGMPFKDSKDVVQDLAKELDFYKYLDKKVKELSGGNKRKLSTAVALIGDPQIIYLDEPSAGMDPATKRYLWNALCKIRDSGKCILLTSHSMEECEALCTRLAIMVNGVFMCLGSTQHLKSKFSKGYTLAIKIRKKDSSVFEISSSEWAPIEAFVRKSFPGATIRERHQELVTFYIADKTLPWSKMFGIMERGKQSLNIEDYSLGQCSLEQVFLTFTKQQREELDLNHK